MRLISALLALFLFIGSIQAQTNDAKPLVGAAPGVSEVAEKIANELHPPLKPVNGHLAGQKHSKTGIPYDTEGFADFSSVTTKTVEITATGNNAKDFAAANKAAGYTETPTGYTWHHHKDGKTMQLVPTDVHANTPHSGGRAVARHAAKATLLSKAIKQVAKHAESAAKVTDIMIRVDASIDIELDYMEGKITDEERINRHTKNVAGMAGGWTGAVVGAKVGAIGGPIGMIVGGIIGYLFGEDLAERIIEHRPLPAPINPKEIVKTITRPVETTRNAVDNVVTWNPANDFIQGINVIGGWFGGQGAIDPTYSRHYRR